MRPPDRLFCEPTPSPAVRVPLTRGLFTWVNEADYALIAGYSWSASKQIGGYARTAAKIDGRWVKVYMHRFLMGLAHGDRRRVDHRDLDTLNNRRGNLRICTPSQNSQNQRKKLGTRSGYKGVWPANSTIRPWIALYTKGRVRHYIGAFPTAKEAARAYDAAVKVAFGEFALPNFPEGSDHV